MRSNLSHRFHQFSLLLLPIALAFLSSLLPAAGDGGGGGGGESGEGNGDFSSTIDEISEQAQQYLELIEQGGIQSALEGLELLHEQAEDNADVYNILGYGYRHQERFDESLAAYKNALTLDPHHPGANEYLGELYLKLDQPELAKERLEVLNRTCGFPCEPREELEEAIEAYYAKR